jgi:glycerol kinase
VGFWNDLEDLRQNWLIDATWDPEMDDETRQELYGGWLKAVRRSMGWVEHE